MNWVNFPSKITPEKKFLLISNSCRELRSIYFGYSLLKEEYFWYKNSLNIEVPIELLLAVISANQNLTIFIQKQSVLEARGDHFDSLQLQSNWARYCLLSILSNPALTKFVIPKNNHLPIIEQQGHMGPSKRDLNDCLLAPESKGVGYILDILNLVSISNAQLTVVILSPGVNLSEFCIGYIEVPLCLCQQDLVILAFKSNDCWAYPPLNTTIDSQLEFRIVARNEQRAVHRPEQSVAESATDVSDIYLEGE